MWLLCSPTWNVNNSFVWKCKTVLVKVPAHICMNNRTYSKSLTVCFESEQRSGGNVFLLIKGLGITALLSTMQHSAVIVLQTLPKQAAVMEPLALLTWETSFDLPSLCFICITNHVGLMVISMSSSGISALVDMVCFHWAHNCGSIELFFPGINWNSGRWSILRLNNPFCWSLLLSIWYQSVYFDILNQQLTNLLLIITIQNISSDFILFRVKDEPSTYCTWMFCKSSYLVKWM